MNLQEESILIQSALNGIYFSNSRGFGFGDFMVELAHSSGTIVSWGSIIGTLSDQTDLQSALNASAITATWGSITGTVSDQADLQTLFNNSLLTGTTSVNLLDLVPNSQLIVSDDTIDSSKSYMVLTTGTAVGWDNFAGITNPNGTELDKTALTNAWDNIAFSSTPLPTVTSLQFKIPGTPGFGPLPIDSNVRVQVGLVANPNLMDGQTTMQYGFMIKGDTGFFEIWESGHLRSDGPATGAGYFQSTDIFALSTDGTTVSYIYNGTVVYSSGTSASGLTLYAQASIYTPGEGIAQANFGTTSTLVTLSLGNGTVIAPGIADGQSLIISNDGPANILFRHNSSNLILPGNINFTLLPNSNLSAIWNQGSNKWTTVAVSNNSAFVPTFDSIIANSITASSGSSAINLPGDTLIDSSGKNRLVWGTGLLVDSGGTQPSLDWENRILTDSSGQNSLDWENRALINANGAMADWSRGFKALVGDTTQRANFTTTQALGSGDAGVQWFDTTLTKPVWWSGTAWVDATGTPV